MRIDIATAETIRSIEAHVAKSSKNAQRALKVSGKEMVKELKRILGLNATRDRLVLGRRTSRRGRRVQHWTSKPGSPPNSDTGFLQNSVKLSSQVLRGNIFVIVGARYARRLEFGPEGRKRLARPFVKPVRDRLEPIFRQRIIQALNDA